MYQLRLIIFICCLPIPLIIGQLAIQPNSMNFWNVISVIFGAIAYSWLSFVLFLGTRPRFIDYSLTQKLHRVLSVLSIIAVYLHSQAENFVRDQDASDLAASFGEIAQTIFLIVTGLSVLFLATKWLVYLPGYVQSFLKKLSFIKYDWIKLIHHISLIAIVLMVLHLIFINISLGAATAGILYIIYIVPALYSYILFVFRKFASKNAQVQCVQALGGSFFKMTLSTKQPISIGQVIWIRRGYKEHPFSIIDKKDDAVVLIFKRTGKFTTYLSLLKKGELISISKGIGKLDRITKPLIYITGGSGVAPAMALISEWEKSPNNPFHLYWSVRTMEELNALDEYFQNLQQTHTNFHYYPFVTREQNMKRLDITKLKENGDLKAAQCYVCASPKAAKSFYMMLKRLSVNKIKVESF